MENRQLRRKSAITYEISSDSDTEEITGQNDSPFGTPQKPIRARQRRSIIDLDDETDTESTASPAKTPPPRLSTAGHSLRQHKELHLSLRAQENGDKRSRRRNKTSKRPKKLNLTSGAARPVPVKSERAQIRNAIATGTAAKRHNFLISHKNLFLPLLPAKNQITKLIEQRKVDSSEADILALSDGIDRLNTSHDQQEDLSVPYEELTQPEGIKAVMKPYQLSGLSFLVWLHRNGLSGILGDEMGLGKTLQTLSLIQYLKNQRKPQAGFENRPSLVVCPLSVLSSWMAETRRWAPDLKVLRYHGPIHERDRLKRIATGDIDMYGRETKGHKIRRNSRMIKNGKPVMVDLDSASETENEVGVDLIVTTYECFSADNTWFKRAFVWNYVILDEGHKIKNDKTQIAKALQALSAEYRLILTGTPLHNDMVELWALLHWLYPEVFTENTSDIFKEAFDLSKGHVSTIFMDDARRLLERIMLRRMKTSEVVNLNLPSKTEVLLYTPLTPMQLFWYQRLMTRADKGLLNELFQDAKQKEVEAMDQEAQERQSWEDKDLEQLQNLDKTGENTAWQESKQILQQALEQEQKDDSKKSAWRKLMNLLMQLRKCCNHPYLLPHGEPDPYYVGEHIMHASGKFIILDKIVKELVIKQRKKILIFSGFTRMLDCCEDFLNLRGGDGHYFKYSRLDGATSRARRNLNIRLFNQPTSEQRIMLISTRAGGLGINLTAASDVVMMDSDWNPQITLQAEARAHRIGQDKPVTIYKLCTQGTVEEQMLGRIQKKLYLSAKVTESMQNIHHRKQGKKRPGATSVAVNDDMPQLDTNQLLSLVRRGARALAHPQLDINDMLSWDFATMIEHCKDKPADALVAKDTRAAPTVKEEDERKWLEQIEQVQSRVFQGKKYSKQKDDYNSIAEEWSRADRRVGKHTTVMVDGFAISKESMSCGSWEAVPTMAGKDPRLAEPKRAKKAAVVNQEVELIGDTLKEYELLEFPSITQAYYICCPSCTDHHRSDASARDFCTKQAMNIDKEYKDWLEVQDEQLTTIDAHNRPLQPHSDTFSMTDASTIDSSPVATPYCITDDGGTSSKKKRKAAPVSFKMDKLPVEGSVLAASPYDSDHYAPATKKKRKVSLEKDEGKEKKRFKVSSSSPLFGH
ncbi:MAG: hypothetical protein L6R40_001812 [Gallowayella cf. fulva]|nr:MAG: hypothetical protein L6R40_001812 [Xanthomendoza cf. fulva]